MNDELKPLPCPMCGANADLMKSSTGFWVECHRGISCNLSQANYDWTESEAVERWNRRAPPVIDDAMVERAASALWAYDIREIEALNFDERFKARRMVMRAALLAAIGQPAGTGTGMAS